MNIQNIAARSGHHFFAHHQQAVFVAGDEFFDDHAAPAIAVRQVVGRLHFGPLHQVERDAAPVVAVVGFHHHRQAYALRGLPCGLGAIYQFAFGHWHAAGLQQGFGQVFVAGDLFCNRAGLVGLGGPDAALRHAVAQLHQIAFGQADVRNAARGGSVHDVRGAGPQAQRIDHIAELGYCPNQVKRGVVDGCLQQFAPSF